MCRSASCSGVTVDVSRSEVLIAVCSLSEICLVSASAWVVLDETISLLPSAFTVVLVSKRCAKLSLESAPPAV